MPDHATEVSRGERFEFGANWARFLTGLNDERIAQAEKSLKDMLGVSDLAGKHFWMPVVARVCSVWWRAGLARASTPSITTHNRSRARRN